jgi:hypothetical protein
VLEPVIKNLLSGLLLVPILLALTGCFSPSTVWVKEGASPEELRYARDDCATQASGYRFVDEARYDGLERDRGSSATGDVYRQCMQSHGWRRERPGDKPAK